MMSFLDEDTDKNSFCVGIYEGFRHPVSLYPDITPGDIPKELSDDLITKFSQYMAGFYVSKVCIVGVVLLMIYTGYADYIKEILL